MQFDIAHAVADILAHQTGEVVVQRRDSFAHDLVQRGGGVGEFARQGKPQEQSPIIVIVPIIALQPGAKRSELAGLHGEALKIFLAAPPVEGRANEALLKFVAGLFDVPVRQVELKQGGQSRYKVVTITGSRIESDSLLSS